MTWRWSTLLESAAAAATRPHPSTRRRPAPRAGGAWTLRLGRRTPGSAPGPGGGGKP